MLRYPFQQDQLENMTMSCVTLTDVEWINLNVLVVIRAGLQYDLASTCCRYGLNTAQASIRSKADPSRRVKFGT